MVQKIKVGDKEYEAGNLSDQAKTIIAYLDFITIRIQELSNTKAILQRAKKSYVQNLKNEMLSSKTGLIIDDD